MKGRSSVLRLVRRIMFAVGFIMLAYAGGTLAYAEVYQRYEAWKFAGKIDTIDFTRGSAVVAEPVELSEGLPIGKLEIPHVGISVMVLQGVEESTLQLGAG